MAARTGEIVCFHCNPKISTSIGGGSSLPGLAGDTQCLIEAALRDTDPDNRYIAARALGDLGAVDAVEPLVRLLDAGDEHLRSAAIVSLGKIRDRNAVARLVSAANHDEVDFVRAWALDAMGKIEGRRAVPWLIRFLDDPQLKVRHAAAWALGSIGDSRALDPLERAREREPWHRRKPYRQAIRTIRAGARMGKRGHVVT